MQSRITELDPPRRIAFAWDASGDVSFELEPKLGKVPLTVTHRRLPDRATMTMVAAGWHMHLDILVARQTGRHSEPLWDGWSRLEDGYDRRLPARCRPGRRCAQASRARPPGCRRPGAGAA